MDGSRKDEAFAGCARTRVLLRAALLVHHVAVDTKRGVLLVGLDDPGGVFPGSEQRGLLARQRAVPPADLLFLRVPDAGGILRGEVVEEDAVGDVVATQQERAGDDAAEQGGDQADSRQQAKVARWDEVRH